MDRRFVEVVWYDAAYHGPWRDLDEITLHDNLREIRTRGWLVRDGKFALTLAMSQYASGPEQIFGGTWSIPKAWIKDVFNLPQPARLRRLLRRKGRAR